MVAPLSLVAPFDSGLPIDRAVLKAPRRRVTQLVHRAPVAVLVVRVQVHDEPVEPHEPPVVKLALELGLGEEVGYPYPCASGRAQLIFSRACPSRLRYSAAWGRYFPATGSGSRRSSGFSRVNSPEYARR